LRAERSFVNKLLGVLMLAMVALNSIPSQALAFTIDVNNPYSEKMDVAFIDFEDQVGKWRIHGWFSVNPTTTRRINMPSSTMRNYIYMYVQTANAMWSGEGIPSSMVYTVVGNAFNYYEGQTAPAGPNRRQVFFVKYELDKGFMYWTPDSE